MAENNMDLTPKTRMSAEEFESLFGPDADTENNAEEPQVAAAPTGGNVTKKTGSERKNASIRGTDNAAGVPRLRAPASEQFSVLRNVPKVMIQIARQEFPDAANNTDAFVAYLFCYCPGFAENNTMRKMLTDAQSDLINHHADSAFMSVATRVTDLKKKMDKLANDNWMLKMLMLYLLYDQLGMNTSSTFQFSKENMDQFDITDNGGLLDFADLMDKSVDDFKRRKITRDGRPYNF